MPRRELLCWFSFRLSKDPWMSDSVPGHTVASQPSLRCVLFLQSPDSFQFDAICLPAAFSPSLEETL